MNLNSLLLGTTFIAIASYSAFGADAVEVVAEPEPMEYVRVCDAYGTGYFYIPGTETCLRVGGYVRYDIGIGDLWGHQDVPDRSDVGSFSDTYHKEARFSFQTWTGSETELGTLSTFTEVRHLFTDPYDGDENSWSLNFAWVQLGGLRIGRDESLFSTFPGYAGGVIYDDLVPYGPFDTNLISYTFDAGNGFSAAVALEEGTESYDHQYALDSYVPHVVAGAKYAGDWGGVTVVGGYDSVHEEFAAKARLDVTVNEQISLFVMGGWGTSDSEEPFDVNGDGVIAPGEVAAFSFYKPWGGDWAIWGGGSATVTEKATVNVQLAYDDADNFGAAANVAYELVPGLMITPEVNYLDNLDVDGDEAWGGVLRFERNF